MLIALAPGDARAQIVYSDTVDVILKYAPGNASRNGYEEAGSFVRTYLGNCVGYSIQGFVRWNAIHFHVNNIYWYNGKRLQVPQPFASDYRRLMGQVDFITTVNGRTVTLLVGDESSSTCRNWAHVGIKTSELWPEKATREERKKAIDRLSMSNGTTSRPLINPELQQYFADQEYKAAQAERLEREKKAEAARLETARKQEEARKVEQARREQEQRASAQTGSTRSGSAASGGSSTSPGSSSRGSSGTSGSTAGSTTPQPTAAERQRAADAERQRQADQRRADAQRDFETAMALQKAKADRDRANLEAKVELVKTGIDLIGKFVSDRREAKRLEEEQARERATAAYETRIAEMRALHGVECNFARDAIDIFVTSSSTAGKLDDGACMATPNSARAVAFRFYVDSPGAHIIAVLTRDFQPKAVLLDARGNPHLGWSESEDTEFGRKILKRVNVPRPGEYFLVVSGQGATTGAFAVQVNIPRSGL